MRGLNMFTLLEMSKKDELVLDFLLGKRAKGEDFILVLPLPLPARANTVILLDMNLQLHAQSWYI